MSELTFDTAAARQMYLDVSFRERLFSRLILDPSGCLLWTGTKTSDGYGMIRVGSRKDGSRTMKLVHRVTYEIFDGPIPDDMTIDHVWARGCKFKHCANVGHLEVVTNRVNTLRGGSVSALCAAKTHCDHGHPFDEVNTLRAADGSRQCRICRRMRAREATRRYRARQKEAKGA